MTFCTFAETVPRNSLFAQDVAKDTSTMVKTWPSSAYLAYKNNGETA